MERRTASSLTPLENAPVAAFGSLLSGRLDKCGRNGQRSASLADTWARISGSMRQVGVTRLSDVTGLDRLGIPVYQAIAPSSQDLISTYGGKGPTVLAAKVSALMEAIERYVACLQPPVDYQCSVVEVRESGFAFLDPRDQNLALSPNYADSQELAWCWGYDLAQDCPVLVASEQAGDSWHRVAGPVNSISTTNGLASGNNVAEAVLHGLFEVLERDAWTLAGLIGEALPILLERVTGNAAQSEMLRPLDLSSFSPRVQALAKRFVDQGVLLQVFAILTDIRVPTVLAVSTDSSSYLTSHCGLGTDADPEIAAVRAITEVAQSRAGDISGGREDLSLPGEDVPDWLLHTQRTAEPSPWHGGSRAISTTELPGFASDDILQDLRETVRRVRDVGLDRVIVVDLSRAEIPAAVCRVIVPGAESWAADHSLLGARATAAWNAAVLRHSRESTAR